ncbi:MAG: PorV/PorQ family protein [Bacteroidetes bacterium]|nr:PorV/PorQ family protein [Bacteroidota bacterium]
MKRHLALCACVLALGTSGALGEDFNKAGRTVMQFLKIGIGGHQSALGECGVVAVRDVNSMFWNPAGISGIQNVEASFSYNNWFVDLKYLAGAAGVRIPDVGIVSVGFASLDYGNIQEALVRGQGTSSDTRTGGTFGGGDMMVSLSFAREFSDQLAIGLTGKYVREKLFNYSAGAFAFDVGTYYNTGFKGIRFGMSFQNFSESVKFLDQGAREEGYDLPLVFRLGASFDLVEEKDGFIPLGDDHRVVMSFEALNTNDFGERYHVGAEYSFMDFIHLRGGYRFNYAEGNLSFGVGLQKQLSSIFVSVDYSFVSYEFLESPHRVTLTVAF